MNKETKNVSNRLLKVGLFLLFISLLTVGVVLYTRSKDLIKTNNTPQKEESDNLALYKNSKYGYSIAYPSVLKYQLTENKGDYLEFISFLTNPDSDINGFAIGVSNLSLEKELEKIKKGFKDNEAKLEEEKDMSVKGLDAKRLYYKPKDINFGEERVVVVVAKDNITYSISAHPEDIDDLLINFNLIRTISPTKAS